MKKNIEKVLNIAMLMLAVVVVLSPDAFAQSENIQSSLGKVQTWVISVIGGFVTVMGLVFTGIKYTSGDERAMETGKRVVIGGLMIVMAPWIYKLLQSFVG